MKKFTQYKKILALAAFGLVASCNKDFLDVNTNRYLTEQRKKEIQKESAQATEKLIQASLEGVYNDYIATPGAHDAFGLKALMLALDLTGEDMIQTRHSWFGFDYNFDNREAPYRRTKETWNLFYKQIAQANIILEDYFSQPASEERLKRKEAEVRGIRGIAYYYLVNIYQQTYKGSETKLGVPLLLSVSDKNKPRETVQKVYEQIISDLTYAVDNNVVTADKKDVDKAVAAAYLAKAYAAKEEWSEVEKYAEIAVGSTPLTSLSTVASSKWDISATSWLWGYDINLQNYTRYASFYSHIDNTIVGYAGAQNLYKSIYNKLYDKIADTDVRKKLFINEDLFPDIAKTYKVLPKYANIKYITNPDITSDYCFLRVEDPYLLWVEALVEQNKLDQARDALKKLMNERDSSYDPTGFTTQQQLREELRTQRRIELWGEGSAFFDFKRWKLSVDRDTPGSNHRTKVRVPAGDKRWVYQIPQPEVEANTNLGGQNP